MPTDFPLAAGPFVVEPWGSAQEDAAVSAPSVAYSHDASERLNPNFGHGASSTTSEAPDYEVSTSPTVGDYDRGATPSDDEAAASETLFVDLFLGAHDKPPREIVLDLDATDDPLH